MQIMLVIVILAGTICNLVIWTIAYNRIEGIESWSVQSAALSPWWFLDSDLLKPEDDHLRMKAGISVMISAIGCLGYLACE